MNWIALCTTIFKETGYQRSWSPWSNGAVQYLTATPR